MEKGDIRNGKDVWSKKAFGVFMFFALLIFLTAREGKGGTQPKPSVGGDWLMVSAGAMHTCAIAKDKTLWCWGRNEYGQLGDGTYGYENTPVNIPKP